MTAPSLAEFLDRISAGRDGVPISIDEAQQVSGLNRGAVLERFRRLQSEGEGYLRLGRHGHPTRFYFRSTSVAKPGSAAADNVTHRVGNGEALRLPVVLSPEESPPIASASEHRATLVEHRYRLRPDLNLTISLPADLDEREAHRIARFIETLPL